MVAAQNITGDPNEMEDKRSRIFSRSLILFTGAYVFLKLVFPFVARLIAGTEVNLPVPGTLFVWYITLIAVSFFIYISSSEKDLRDFLHPIVEAIRGRGGAYRAAFRIVFVGLPLFVGYQIYDSFVPRVVVPAVTRQQHPGMSHAGAAPYADLENPHRQPTAKMLEEFVVAYEACPSRRAWGTRCPPRSMPHNSARAN